MRSVFGVSAFRGAAIEAEAPGDVGALATGAALAALLTVAALFAALLVPTVASAARGHAFSKSFPAGGGPCEVTVLEPCEGKFKEPSGVAVSEATGDVYVLDQGNERVEVFGPEGSYISQFNGSATPAGAFAFGSEPLTGGIAIDNSCALHPAEPCTDPSSGDVYVTDRENGVVDKFNAEGVYLSQLEQASGAAFDFGHEEISGSVRADNDGVGVDANGTVWAYYYGTHVVGDVPSFTDAEPGTFISTRELAFVNGGGFTAPGFAVDSEDNLYARKTEASGAFEVSKYSSSGESLIAPLPAEESSAVAVDLSSNDVFVDNVGSISAFSKTGREEGHFGFGHLIRGSGLAASHANETVYVADSATDVVDVFSPAPPSKPTVAGESASSVSSESATLGAEVNPDSVPAEHDTEYRFEYITEDGYRANLGAGAPPFTGAVVAGEGSLAPAFEFHAVTPVHVQGLLADTVYHYRLLAENEVSKTEGKAVEGERNEETGEEVPHTFTTQRAGGGLVLPDGRNWELVSPPDKHGALLKPITEAGIAQASSSGSAVSYLGTIPTEEAVPGYALTEQIISSSGGGGWSSQDISPPHAAATGGIISSGGEYRFFSEDLSLAVVEPQGPFTSLAPDVSPSDTERTPYLRRDLTCATHPADCFQPLLTAAPGFADVPPGTEFGGDPEQAFGVANFVGGTPDLTHVVLASKVALTDTPASGNILYESSPGSPPGEELQLASVLPCSPAPCQGKPAGGTTTLGLPAPGDFSANARHAISDDGSRIVWSEVGGHLYMRDMTTAQTVQLDVPEPSCTLCGAGAVTPAFQIASHDGSKVFFTDSQGLTEGSSTQAGEPDLYECEIAEVEGELKCKLSDLTPPHSGENAAVQGLVLGASEDGDYVYFVANGVLGDGASRGALTGNCKLNSDVGEGACNLYVWHDGAAKFVAMVSGEDYPDWSGLTNRSLSEGGETSRVSPSGRYLAFMSSRSLTGYDNHDASSGKPDEEVFLFDAREGRLVCASCDPTGARPTGVEYAKLGNGTASLAGGSAIWEPHTWLAANIPAWTAFDHEQALHQSRYLSDSGRLFFNTSDALVPQDINKNEDVYEYEPASTASEAPPNDSCASASATYSPGSHGCISLISSGTASGESGFLDASQSGNDVFFLTAERLVPEDVDSSVDLYDAHVCAASSPCISSTASQPACTTADACRAAPTPQPSLFGAPPSATFSGPGDIAPSPAPPAKAQTAVEKKAKALAKALKACEKYKRKPKRKRCEDSAKKRYGSVKKANKSDRRAGR